MVMLVRPSVFGPPFGFGSFGLWAVDVGPLPAALLMALAKSFRAVLFDSLSAAQFWQSLLSESKSCLASWSFDPWRNLTCSSSLEHSSSLQFNLNSASSSWCWSCWLVLNASTRSCFSWLASFWAFNVFFFSSCTLFRVFFQASSKYAAAVFSSLSSLISAGLPSRTLSSTHTGQTTEREQIVFPFKIKSSANLQIKYIIPAPLAWKNRNIQGMPMLSGWLLTYECYAFNAIQRIPNSTEKSLV